MLYTFGDSITFGADLLKQGYSEQERKNIIWPSLLSKLIEQPFTDYSFPGASNWRIARQIQNLPLTPDDVVAIQWTVPIRFEFGVSDDYDYESNLPDEIHPYFKTIDIIHNDNGVRTKDMCYGLVYRTTESACKDFMKIAYSKLNNQLWYQEMFRIMVQSTLYVLEKSGCKYIMFDGWMQQCDEKYFKDIPNYILRGTTISNYCRNVEGVDRISSEYASKEEHVKTATVIYQELRQIYGDRL